jgi:uncharacterized delta-60 repeat protein
MKKTLLSLYLLVLSIHLSAQVVDSTFGVLGSLYTTTNYFYGLTACDFDGRRDQTFSALHLPDGRIVLAGNSAAADGNDIAIARLMPDGQYDQTLGPNGQLRFHLGSDYDTCLTAIVYDENRLLLAGGMAPLGTNIYNLFLYRTDLDGNPDTTFGNGGKVIIELPSYRELVTELRALPDGRIIVAGNALGPADELEGSVGSEVFVGRLLENGAVDTSFGEGGFFYRHWESECNNSVLGDLSMDNQGRIVITGAAYDTYIGFYSGVQWCDNEIVVCRYSPDGQVDSTFGNNGAAIVGMGGRGNALLHYEDGRIFVAGLSGPTKPIFSYFVRLMPDGSFDTSFSTDGKLSSIISMTNASTSGVPDPFGVVRVPGRIVAGALMGIETDHRGFGAMALTENGKIDSTFAQEGMFPFFSATTPRVYMNEITSTDPDHFFLSGYYRTLQPANMFIGKVRLTPPNNAPESNPHHERFSMYPNPVVSGNQLIFDLEGLASNERASLLLTIRDLHGRVVLEQLCPEQTDAVIMSTSDLSPGLYFVELRGSSIRHTGRLVVVAR